MTKPKNHFEQPSVKKYYCRKHDKTIRLLTVYGIFVCSLFVVASGFRVVSKIQSPIHQVQAVGVKQTVTPTATPLPSPSEQPIVIDEHNEERVDLYVGEAIEEFFGKNRGQSSEMRMIMHCLLYRESKHGLVGKPTDPHGDGGLAGGPLQFHPGTWTGYRKIMMEQKSATEIGSRYDLKEAIRTTVWAIKDGRGLAWGPILRDKNNATWSTCPYPSFYKR